MIDGHIHMIPRSFNENHTNITFDWPDLDEWLSKTPKSKAVIMSAITQYCDSEKINDDFFQEIEKFKKKNRIFPLLWVHPYQLTENVFKKYSFSGLKFHPSISQSTIDQNIDMINLCEKYKKPILIHCGRGEKSRIDYILNINKNYKNTKFICAHLGGLATDIIIRAFEKIKNAQYKDNIYMDTSGCFYPKLINRSIDLLGIDKIIFGSDRPFHDVSVSAYAIKRCGLKKIDLEKIYNDNIMEVINP